MPKKQGFDQRPAAGQQETKQDDPAQPFMQAKTPQIVSDHGDAHACGQPTGQAQGEPHGEAISEIIQHQAIIRERRMPTRGFATD
jgi:hypothetical protein